MIWIAQVTISSSAYGIISSKIPSKVRGKYLGYYNAVFFLSFGMGGTLITGPISDILIFEHIGKVLAYSYAYLGAVIVIIIGSIIGIKLFYQSRKVTIDSTVY